MAPNTTEDKPVQDDDNDEIDLNSGCEDNEEENDNDKKDTSTTPDNSDDKKPSSKKSKLQERLRKLKLKINQTKQMNHQQVIQEGERLSSKEAFQKHKKQTLKNDTKQKEKEQWDNVHEKNVSTLLDSSGNGDSIHGKKKEVMALTQSGNDSLRQSFKKMEKKEKSQYSTNDYYNSEGQLRNYERSLKSLNSHGGGSSTNANNNSSYHSSSTTSSNEYNNQSAQEKILQRERNGAKRLADELKRRAAKAEKRKQKDMDFEGTDVSYINKRNKHFNEKINRNYDKHTAEIRQNLERGTAL